MCLSFCSLTTLTALSLPTCSFTAIDPAVANLAKLERLNLNENQFFPEVPYQYQFGHAGKASIYSNMFNRWLLNMQVPQELAGLTTLTYLSLLENSGSREAAVALGVHMEGVALEPKMRVTEQGCRFLLHFPALAKLNLLVTAEEKAALAGFVTELQRGRSSPVNV